MLSFICKKVDVLYKYCVTMLPTSKIKRYICNINYIKHYEMKKYFFFFFLLICGVATYAQRSKTEILHNPLLAANGYYAYPGPLKSKLTPAPKGYKPFYISHYGRHGSRYLIEPTDYTAPLHVLQHADSLGKLTPLGKDVLYKVTLICNEAYKRLGELTQLGAEQHQQIAKRMFQRFPEVFRGKTHVDAKSSTVIRCILSMENALQQLVALNPKLQITHDASAFDMPYLVYGDTELYHQKMPGRVKDIYEAFAKKHDNHVGVMNRLFNDEQYWRNNINATDLNYQLYTLASNVQSTELRHHLSLINLFTPNELYDAWLKTNAWWYINYGPSPLNGAVQPYSQRMLLRRIITEADSCIALSHPGATLRYGHDTIVMPLVCLLDINGYGKQIKDLEQLDNEDWLDYRIFPMACNLQFVFYRSSVHPHDILVKVLLNENETLLPLSSNVAPYYHWSNFKAYYLQKIDSFKGNQDTK